MRALARAALLFVAIGLALYAGLYLAAESLLQRTGHANPMFKIAAAPAARYDWVILGASHAMPLDFGGFNERMEKETGLRILNLAAQGTGPLYQRFAFEEFLRAHSARNVLYVVDSFALRSRTWNEERFSDAKLTRGTPFAPGTLAHLWRYARDEGVDARAVLDYGTGFSKVNNRERFRPDAWEGEAQFDRVYRSSATALRKRIEYLHPEGPDVLQRYLGELDTLIARARAEGMGVAVVKMPVPPQFAAALPGEPAFDEALARLLASRGVPLHDFSASIREPRFYFDSDHLNRAGVEQFFTAGLRPVLAAPSAPPQ